MKQHQILDGIDGNPTMLDWDESSLLIERLFEYPYNVALAKIVFSKCWLISLMSRMQRFIYI